MPEPFRPISPTASPGTISASHVPQRPDVLSAGAAARDDQVLERSRLARVDTESPGDAVGEHGADGHPRSLLMRTEVVMPPPRRRCALVRAPLAGSRIRLDGGEDAVAEV